MHKLLILLLSGLLISCSSAKIKDYKNEKPVLIMEEYFNGTIDAYGIFQDRSGKIVKKFQVVMKASWVNGVGTLDEDFTYSDGTKQKRVWTLRKNAKGQYIGTAGDVIGEAVGEAAGNAFRWKYTLDLKVDKDNYHVKFDDWMYLMDDRVMLNKSSMSKLGIHLGGVTLSFYKRKI